MTPAQVASTIARAAGGYNTCALRVDGVDHPCTAFVGSFTGASLWNPMVAIGDRRVYLAADGLDLDPEMTHEFIDADGAVLHMVSKPSPVEPGPPVLLWELHCRG